MAVVPSRLDELRRRVDDDPASLAFAALAEECRRQGQLQQAIDTCRAGLRHHPEYVSARVTLARALLDLGDQEAAKAEFEQVIRLAPENLAGIRGLAEICRRPAEGIGAAALAAGASTPATAAPGVPGGDGAAASAAHSAAVGGAPAAAPRAEASPQAEAGLRQFLDEIRRTRAELGR